MGLFSGAPNPFGSGGVNYWAPWALSPGTAFGMQALGMDPSNPFAAPQQPPSPDFVGAAEATAAGNLQGAQAATQANRAAQVNPFGSLSWTQGPEGQWTQNVSFSPEQQALYESTTQGKQDILGQGAPSFGSNRERVMNAMMGRVSGDIGREREDLTSQLRARGIPPGSPAYEAEMDRLNRKEVDARQQAEIAATQQAGTEYGAELAGRGQQIGALGMFGPTSPSFNQFYQQQAIPGADYMGAAQEQAQWDLAGYNADVQRQNALMQGLFSLGGSAIAASDRRLKKNIKKIGKYLSLNVYEFSYLWDDIKHIGFMSDEVRKVRPDAVIKDIYGYDKVIYGVL